MYEPLREGLSASSLGKRLNISFVRFESSFRLSKKGICMRHLLVVSTQMGQRST